MATLNKKPSSGSKHNPSMWVLLLYYPVARRNFFIITFNWLTNALVYNGLTFYSADLGVSSHLGFFISSAVEIPSYFMGWFVMDKWGRRWCLFLTMMTGGISCISCLFVPIGTLFCLSLTISCKTCSGTISVLSAMATYDFTYMHTYRLTSRASSRESRDREFPGSRALFSRSRNNPLSRESRE